MPLPSPQCSAFCFLFPEDLLTHSTINYSNADSSQALTPRPSAPHWALALYFLQPPGAASGFLTQAFQISMSQTKPIIFATQILPSSRHASRLITSSLLCLGIRHQGPVLDMRPFLNLPSKCTLQGVSSRYWLSPAYCLWHDGDTPWVRAQSWSRGTGTHGWSACHGSVTNRVTVGRSLNVLGLEDRTGP